jgi:zinc-ribbon family
MFFVIWGFKRYVSALAMLTLVCGHCHRPTAHPLRKVVTKFTLFWIPLFRTSTKYVLQCSYCGVAQTLPEAEAERLMAAAPTGEAHVEGLPTSPPPQYRDAPSGPAAG